MQNTLHNIISGPQVKLIIIKCIKCIHCLTYLPEGPRSPMMCMVCTGVLMMWLFFMNSSEGSHVIKRDLGTLDSLNYGKQK